MKISVVLLLYMIYICSGYKVLIYSSKFGFSHMNFLTVLQPVIIPTVRGTGCRLAKVLTVEEDEATIKATDPFRNPELWSEIWTIDTSNPIGVIIHAPTLAGGFNAGMKNVLGREDVMNQLRREKFDLAITEMFDYGGFPVFHELGIPTIIGVHSTVMTDRTSWAIGNPIQPSYVPPMNAAAGDDGSFSSRLNNMIFTLFTWQFERILEAHVQTYMDQKYPEAPKISETIGNMPFIFTNTEPFLDFPRAKLHKVVDLGGIGLKPAKKLDENWMKILSQRKRNVLISFGSIAPSYQMPTRFKENLLTVFKKFPDVTFIWKYETPEDGFGKDVPNLHLSKWTPQADLLASGQIDLFITHGGAGSILEGASSGVPLIVVPLFGDQHRNALATEFNKHSLASEVEFETAVRKGLEDERLKDKAKEAKELLKARPFPPGELLVRHVDLTVKFGNLPNLAPSGRQFSIIQYHNLDVIAFLVLIGLMISAVVVVLMKWCFCKARIVKFKQQ